MNKIYGVYESDFGDLDISDDTFPLICKPDYRTQRVAYLEWKKVSKQQAMYERRLNRTLEFLWLNDHSLSDFEWKNGWIQRKDAL